MPEFGEDAVIYFDPHNIADLKNQILNVDDDVKSIKRYSEKALLASRKYNFEKTIRKNIDYILENKNENL